MSGQPERRPAEANADREALPAPQRKAVTFRAFAIACVILPVNSYWVVQMEVIRYSSHPTTISLFFNAVFILLVLTVVNRLVAVRRPTLALTRGELMLIYSGVCIGSAISGHDSLEVFVPMLTWSFKHADASNGWASLINTHLPGRLFISDPSVYRGYYIGNDTIWRWQYVRAWLPVVGLWTIFVSALLLVMLCVNSILRKQWTDNERLTYPIVQLPLQITHESAFERGGLFRNRLFWLAFLLAGAIDTINSLNYYYPSIPTVLTPGFGESFLNIGPYFTTKPWSAIGWTPLSFYPFMIGLGMFMPLDFLFSCVFFYWMWKLEKVMAVAMAWDQDPRFPYTANQAAGAYFSFCVFAIWVSRHYLANVIRGAFTRGRSADDTTEPMTYRLALGGIAVGGAILIGYAVWLGMTWWIAVLFFTMYFGIAVAITRMRAELGTPMHDLHETGPELIFTRVAGSKAFDAPNLTALSTFFWFNRAYRSNPMPIQLESYKLAEQSDGDYRSWARALMALGVIGTFVAFWAILYLNYHYGAEGRSKMTFGNESYDLLTTWLKSPQPGKFSEMAAIWVGAGIAILLQWLRVRFPWWPLHPLAFAVTSSWEINLVWLPLCIAWILKTVILRYGGRQGFHKSLPFFVGLMLGQFTVGSLWNIYGIIRDLPTYQFWQ